MPVIALLLASFALASPVPARGQDEARLDSLLRANAYPLDVSSAGLSGPGADLLLGLDGVQFVSIGESHNIAEIPLFTGALLRTLSARGFHTVAFENGPVIMSMLAEAEREGGPEAAFDLAGRYPHGMQFWTDEEVALAT
ncbi:MAG: hypothetical protein R3266_11525, partial [Gemmatimonadota bacterium]|nr:hypothetical protein [Gemmatimonadota bacterium]